MTSSHLRRRLVRGSALAVLTGFAGGICSAAVRPRINRWGATDDEHRATWPGDELVDRPGLVWTNAITIERPADEVWPWVTQLGQDRGGLYSYDWLENLIAGGVHSTDRILPEFQRPLAVGDREIRMVRYGPSNPVAVYQPGRALVLGDVNDTDADLAAGRSRGTWAFIVQPVDAYTSRLIIRSRHRGTALMPSLQGPIQFVMQRKMMLGIKQRAENTWSPSPADVAEPLLWFVAAALFTTAATRTLTQREQWWRPCAVAPAAVAELAYLLFWQPTLGAAAALDGALVFALLASRPGHRPRPGGDRRPGQ